MRLSRLLIPFLLCILALYVPSHTRAQDKTRSRSTVAKKISPDLFGVFFEDISYAADGGLYAELIQNRSFEYNPSDVDAWNSKRKDWNSFTAWEYTSKGYGYGTVSVESKDPIHPNNPHFLVLNVEDPGREGVGLINHGFDGIAVRQQATYNFSVFIKTYSAGAIPFTVKLLGRKGDTLALANFSADEAGWKKYTCTLTASGTDDSCSLVITTNVKSKFGIDMVSLFPQATFKNRSNGLRADLAQAIADLSPKFVRFPGGCLVHGDGLGNMYQWKNTIGPVEQRVDQKNIWNYHQSVGLGYYEYFTFCEDIGAKPLPVLAAAVSCQNSGGTWRIGSTGQKALPMEDMQNYIQDILDLIEWANGPATSTWGAKRAAAGHPQPFGLKYLGIGNEDKITPEFKERFTMIYNVIRSKHPEITLVGTVGPFPAGEDYDLGWKLANQLHIPVVDEHYYQRANWFLNNTTRYDNYDRSKSHVYLGEYAAKGNTLLDALSEAVYMTSLERNGDVVQMASYAPLLANTAHLSWTPDLIYFNNTTVSPSINYYVQKLFSVNQGDMYYPDVISFRDNNKAGDSVLAVSCTRHTSTGDLILKIVNAGNVEVTAVAELSRLGITTNDATLSLLSGEPGDILKGSSTKPVPVVSTLRVQKHFSYKVPPYSLTVIRIAGKNKSGG